MIRTLPFFLAFFIAHISITAQCWEMVWADEFNGTDLDRTVWNTGYGHSWGSLQFNTGRRENVDVSNDTLKVIAREENYEGFNYTSAKLTMHKSLTDNT